MYGKNLLASWVAVFTVTAGSVWGQATTGDGKPTNQGEFSAHGSGVVRVELEAKLRVPLEKTDLVWEWLSQRYSDCSWLNQDGHRFVATFGDEEFTDVYFDTPDLQLLKTDSGVRHRSRVVHSGSATIKDGRQLLQIKLNRNDPSHLGRSEIKFNAATPSLTKLRSKSVSVDDVHCMLGLVEKNQRDACKKQFQELGLDPYSMRPILTVQQNRRRVYLSDQQNAFATVTLDLCKCDSWNADLVWTEIELELNEIRYTEANPEQRKAMEKFVGLIQSDLQKQFPDIIQDQTPKYTKAFRGIEAETWVPLRVLIQRDIEASEFRDIYQIAILFLVAVLGCGLLWVFRKKWMSGDRAPSERRSRPAVA